MVKAGLTSQVLAADNCIIIIHPSSTYMTKYVDNHCRVRSLWFKEGEEQADIVLAKPDVDRHELGQRQQH